MLHERKTQAVDCNAFCYLFIHVKLIVMKKITVCAMLIIFSAASFSQETHPSPSLTQNDYLKKSKRQKTTGLILLSGGVAVGVIGILASLNSNDIGILYLGTLVGGGMVIASVPFFNASARNKEKAKNAFVSLRLEKVQSIQRSQLSFHEFPAISIKLGL
jgi:hypothetical protein